MDRLVVYELHVGTYTPRAPSIALIDQLPEIARARGDRDRADAGRRLPRPLELGLRRRRALRPIARLRPARTTCVAWSTPRTPRPRACCSTSSTTTSDPMAITSASTAPTTSPTHGRHGATASTYDGPNSRFVRDFSSRTGASGCATITSTASASTRPTRSRTTADSHHGRVPAKVRAAAAKPIVLIAEESRNSVRTDPAGRAGRARLRRGLGGRLPPRARVHLTGTREHYYADYEGSVAEIAKAINEGFVYQGQRSPNSRPRGTRVTDEPATGFVVCIQNHDQVGNRPFGERVHHDIHWTGTRWPRSPPVPAGAASAFMGQEFAASTPFLFFTDHNEELGRLVTKGRRRSSRIPGLL